MLYLKNNDIINCSPFIIILSEINKKGLKTGFKLLNIS